MEHLILTLVVATIAVGLLVSIFYTPLLTLEMIVDWFNEQLSLVSNDEDMIAFTVRNSKVNLIQGILDRSKEKLLATREIKANKISPEVAGPHVNHEVVIYT